MIFDNKMRVELIKHNASDEDVARAAWVSNYGEDARTKEPGKIEGLIKFLYKNRHMSPFEHGSFTFFVDVPIFVAREFMRHRTFSYNEVSGRYKELEPKFYVPDLSRPLVQEGKPGAYRFSNGTKDQWNAVDASFKSVYSDAWKHYKRLIDFHGVAREVARDILPLGTYTQFYATCNPRNLMQFLTLRNAPDALAEIQDTAEQMEEYFEDAMPLTYKAYKSKATGGIVKAGQVIGRVDNTPIIETGNSMGPHLVFNYSPDVDPKDIVKKVIDELKRSNRRRPLGL